MALIIEGGLDLPLPRMIPVRQKFPDACITDIPGEIERLFRRDEKMKRIRAGSRIAVAVGSRGIHAIDRITRTVIDEIRRLGANPFVVPSMGSHGGATAEGQRKIWPTSGSRGVHGRARRLVHGDRPGGFPRGRHPGLAGPGSDGCRRHRRDQSHKAPHSLRGRLRERASENGRHRPGQAPRATDFHSCGMDRFGELLPKLGRVVLEKAPILFGLAVIENAYERPARLEIVWSEDMIGREPALLKEARALMPRVIPGDLDVLIVHEIGKEISGSGMDPNITGRSSSPFFRRENSLKVQRIVVLNLSKASGGSAMGIGLADFSTDKAVKAMNLDTTWINCITAGVTASGKIPIHMPTDREAILLALKTCSRVRHPQSRIVWIRNTLALEQIRVSEPLLEELKNHPQIEIAGDSVPMPFDEQGNLLY